MSIIVRQDDVRRQNQFGVLMALRRHGPMSRTELSAATGLSASTVTVITNSLMERGALSADPIAEAGAQRRGRPQVSVRPRPAHATIAVVFVGLNTIQTALADYSGQVFAFETRTIATKRMTSEALGREVTGFLGEMLDKHAGDAGPLLRISAAVEGIVDADRKTLLSSPVIDLINVPLGQYLEDRFDVDVEISNESNMIAEALHWRAPERYGANFATVLLSTGVGMGLYMDGRMFSGVRSSAVEFGHTNFRPDGALCRCGRRGCIEAYAGTYSLWRAVRGVPETQLLEEDPPADALQTLIEAARASDGPERQAFREAGKAIGTGLSNVFTLFDPIPLVFTGPGIAAMEFMESSIHEALSRACFGQPVPISVVDSYLDYRALIREGCLMRALVFLDESLPDQGETRDRRETLQPQASTAL
jgi:predicted NBD/HSP70 family sugar kinase